MAQDFPKSVVTDHLDGGWESSLACPSFGEVMLVWRWDRQAVRVSLVGIVLSLRPLSRMR